MSWKGSSAARVGWPSITWRTSTKRIFWSLRSWSAKASWICWLFGVRQGTVSGCCCYSLFRLVLRLVIQPGTFRLRVMSSSTGAQGYGLCCLCSDPCKVFAHVVGLRYLVGMTKSVFSDRESLLLFFSWQVVTIHFLTLVAVTCRSLRTPLLAQKNGYAFANDAVGEAFPVTLEKDVVISRWRELGTYTLDVDIHESLHFHI